MRCMAWIGNAWLGDAGQGYARQCKARQGNGANIWWINPTYSISAKPGVAWRGKATQGKAMKLKQGTTK